MSVCTCDGPNSARSGSLDLVASATATEPRNVKGGAAPKGGSSRLDGGQWACAEDTRTATTPVDSDSETRCCR